MTTKAELADRRERWAQALESGKYAQTKGQLRNRDGYCCLGVACDLYSKENGEDWHAVGDAEGSYTFEHHPTALAPDVQSWLGLSDYTGHWELDGVSHSLTDENDGGASFAEIAAIIRAAPEGLFDD